MVAPRQRGGRPLLVGSVRRWAPSGATPAPGDDGYQAWKTQAADYDTSLQNQAYGTGSGQSGNFWDALGRLGGQVANSLVQYATGGGGSGGGSQQQQPQPQPQRTPQVGPDMTTANAPSSSSSSWTTGETVAAVGGGAAAVGAIAWALTGKRR